MNPFQRYLLDEFVEDYKTGEMSRREFVMKVIGVIGEPQRHTDDAIGTGTFLQQHDNVRSDVHGITGFCFGGGVVWRTIGQDQTVAAAAPFYGPPPALDSLAHTRTAALAFYGELDTRITSSAPAVQAALATAGVPHDFKVYPGANHAFFNDTGPSYDKAAATDAWARCVAWFRQYLPAG